MFQVFRRSNGKYFTYYEPVHEIALTAIAHPEVLLAGAGQDNKLRHPAMESWYFHELHQTHLHWRDALKKRIIYDDYFGDVSQVHLGQYYRALLNAANGRPVIQDCRSSCRIGAIKQITGGLHLYLVRNPWDQWWSFKISDYFDAVCQLIIGAKSAPAVVGLLKDEIGYEEYHCDNIQEELRHFEDRRLEPEQSYLIFYTLWMLSAIEAIQHADLIVNMDLLSASQELKSDFASRFEILGIPGVDFSDCCLPQAFFDLKDKEFFLRVEDRAKQLFLASGISEHTLEKVGQIRLAFVHPVEAHDCVSLVRDLRRARDRVLQLEASEARRVSRLHSTIAKLTEGDRCNS